MNDNFERKIAIFTQLLMDAYRDEDERGMFGEELKINSESITEDVTAIIYAVYIFVSEVTGEDEDIIGFTHMMNRLVFQNLLEKKVQP